MDAFISYRRKPSASLALLLQAKLKTEHKIDAYVDTTRADGTMVQFPERLMQAIIDKNIFICILGDTTLDSEWVNKEIEQAYHNHKRCVPVFQESYVPPENPSEAVKYLLNFDGVHVFDVKNVYLDEAVAQIAQIIRGKSKTQKQAFNPLPTLFGVVLIITLLISAFLLAPMLQANSTSTTTDTATDEPRVTDTPTDESTATDTPTDAPMTTPTLLASEHNSRGTLAYNAGNFELAIEEYSQAIELAPNYIAAYNNRCLAYIAVENYEAALSDCDHAIELNPDFATAYANRSNAYIGLADYQATIADSNRAIELDRSYAYAYANRANAYYQLGQYEEALADYQMAEEQGYDFNDADQLRYDELRATVTPNP